MLSEWVIVMVTHSQAQADQLSRQINILDGLLMLLCATETSRFINGAVITADDGFTSF